MDYLHYRLGYSKKGWTDGEIGVEWIKQFDQQTKDKAKGRARLLLVDGHNSHYTRRFLDYAREHNIHVLCYPAHGTHIYQGLDVAVFSVLKRYWAEERDKAMRERGEAVTKQNFLAIYGAAHVRALRPETIASAFRKTGIHPYNPNIVTKAMLAPSRETSNKLNLPIVPPTPVRIVTDLIVDVTQPVPENGHEASASGSRSGSRTLLNSPHAPVRIALPQLKSTTAAFAVSESPVKSSSNPPPVEAVAMEISPILK